MPSIICNIAFLNISIVPLNSLTDELNTTTVSLFAHGWLSSEYSNLFHVCTAIEDRITSWACPSMLLCRRGRHLFPISSRSGMAATCALSLPVSDLLVPLYMSIKSGEMGKIFKKHEEEHKQYPTSVVH